LDIWLTPLVSQNDIYSSLRVCDHLPRRLKTRSDSEAMVRIEKRLFAVGEKVDSGVLREANAGSGRGFLIIPYIQTLDERERERRRVCTEPSPGVVSRELNKRCYKIYIVIAQHYDSETKINCILWFSYTNTINYVYVLIYYA